MCRPSGRWRPLIVATDAPLPGRNRPVTTSLARPLASAPLRPNPLAVEDLLLFWLADLVGSRRTVLITSRDGQLHSARCRTLERSDHPDLAREEAEDGDGKIDLLLIDGALNETRERQLMDTAAGWVRRLSDRALIVLRGSGSDGSDPSDHRAVLARLAGARPLLSLDAGRGLTVIPWGCRQTPELEQLCRPEMAGTLRPLLARLGRRQGLAEDLAGSSDHPGWPDAALVPQIARRDRLLAERTLAMESLEAEIVRLRRSLDERWRDSAILTRALILREEGQGRAADGLEAAMRAAPPRIEALLRAASEPWPDPSENREAALAAELASLRDLAVIQQKEIADLRALAASRKQRLRELSDALAQKGGPADPAGQLPGEDDAGRAFSWRRFFRLRGGAR